MLVNYVCLDLSETDRKRDESAIQQFPLFLDRVKKGISAKVTVRPLPRNLIGEVRALIEARKNFVDRGVLLTTRLSDKAHRGLVICCQSNSVLARKAKRNASHAKYGCHNGWLAVVYHHDKRVVWHEMYHLFRAQDCYDPSDESTYDSPKCRNRHCIMQYDATSELVGDPPYICQPNKTRIRDFLRELEQRARAHTR